MLELPQIKPTRHCKEAASVPLNKEWFRNIRKMHFKEAMLIGAKKSLGHVLLKLKQS